MNDSILRVENISMCFGGVVAVDNVSFEVKKRTIHSLIGPNGAGKTTTISMINGTLPVPSGKIYSHDCNKKTADLLENRIDILTFIKS